MQEDDLKEAFKECGVKRMGDRFKLTERLRVLKSVMTKHLEPESLESQEEYQEYREESKNLKKVLNRDLPLSSVSIYIKLLVFG